MRKNDANMFYSMQEPELAVEWYRIERRNLISNTKKTEMN